MAASAAQIKKAADFGLANVELIAKAADKAGLPFYVACALMERESGGRNVYGHDKGGALSGFPYEVNEGNYRVFEWLIGNGQTSNGVGPCQITWKGFFPAMVKLGLKPWDALDNMTYGMGLLASYYKAKGSWTLAGKQYNGSLTYGVGLAKQIAAWKKRVS